MMGKDFLVYSLLLVAGLGTAYYASLPEEASSDEVNWIRIDPKKVTGLTYKGDGKDIRISQQEGEAGYWVTYSEDKGENQPADTTEFRANEKINEVLDWFNPLYAKRDVGAAKDVDLAEFELDKEKDLLTLSGNDKNLLELQIGKRAYGSRNYFVMDKGKQRVLLVSGSQIENITKANSRMVERRLFDLDIADVSKVELVAGDNNKVLDHSHRNGAGQLIWSDPGKEDEKASYKNLMTKIGKLKVKSYGSAEERQALTTLIPFAELKMFKDGKDAVMLRFFKQGGETPRYWVWSSYLGAYAEIDKSQAENLEKDIPGVVLD